MNRRIILSYLILSLSIAGLHAQTANSRLLDQLNTTDSLKWSQAFLSFIKVDFNKEDLPYMQEALLRHYPDDSDFFNTRDRIANKMEGLTDESTVQFIRAHFPALKGRDEEIKYNFLEILAAYRTVSSYSTLKEMLLQYPPLSKKWNELSYRINDSLPLAGMMYPEILNLVNLPTVSMRILSMTEELFDSSAIAMNMVLPHAKAILHVSDSIASWVKTQTPGMDYYGIQFVDLIQLLGRLGTNEANDQLRKWLTVPETLIKQEAIIALLANKQEVDSSVIKLVAKDKLRRRELHRKLQLIGRPELFPKQYLTQRMMADGDMWTVASDEEEPPTEQAFVGETTATYKGKKSRFYLYRIIYRYDGEVAEYLGASGPYDLDKSKLDTDKKGTGVYFEKQYNKAKNAAQLNSLLKILTD